MPETTSVSFPATRWSASQILLILATVSLVAINWLANDISPDMILRDVPELTRLNWLESRWLYAGLLVFTGSFPILFGFLPQLKFYKVIPLVLLANLPVTFVFIVWDIYFTMQGVWDFSSLYTTGSRFLHIPWEEWMFFIIIPMACTFIYWSLNYAIRKEPFARTEKQITLGLATALLCVGLWKWAHIYTATTAILTSGFLFYHLFFIRPGYRGRFYLAYLVSCIPFLLVNGVLTGGFTDTPVVMYHPEEYFGFRVGTVPADDFIYSLLMLFGNITLFEYLLRRRNRSGSTR